MRVKLTKNDLELLRVARKQAREQRAKMRRKERYGIIHVTLPRDEYKELQLRAARHGMTLSELVRTYITWGEEAHDTDERGTNHRVQPLAA